MDSAQRVVLDMDSTEIPVYGEQKHSRAMDQGGKTGSQDDSSLLSPLSLQRSAARAGPADLQPREPVTTAGAAEEDRELVVDEFAAAVGEDGRATGETCSLLPAAASGRAPEPTEARGDAATYCDAAVADRIESGWLRQAADSVYQGWGGKVLRKWAGIWGISAMMLRIADRCGGPG